MGYPAPDNGGRVDLATRLRVVEDAYSDAHHDLDTVLTRPTLFDATDPVTATFLQARETCLRLPADRGAPTPSWAAEHAVTELENAWQRARREADEVRLSRLGVRERARLRRARRLLHKARSDRGSVPLRQGYFHRAENLLAGLVVLPDPLRAEVIEAVRKSSRVDGPVGEPGGTWV